ncbi:hypothetical protein Tco_0676713 [Tanacetum coccineum]
MLSSPSSSILANHHAPPSPPPPKILLHSRNHLKALPFYLVYNLYHSKTPPKKSTSIWEAFGGNTYTLDSIWEEMRQDCNSTPRHSKICFLTVKTTSTFLVTSLEFSKDEVKIHSKDGPCDNLHTALLVRCLNGILHRRWIHSEERKEEKRGRIKKKHRGFKPQKEYRPVPKKPTASSSSNKKKGVEPTIEVSNSNPFKVLNSVDNDEELGKNEGTTNLVNNGATSSGSSFMNVDNSSTGTTLIIDKIKKFEELLTSGQVVLVDEAGNPLKKVEFLGDYDSEDEVASVDNDMAHSMTSERVDAYDEPIGDLDIMKDKVDNPSPQSTPQVLLSFKVIFDEKNPGSSYEFYVEDSWMTI